MDLDSFVGTATRYGLDGPGIESWWGGGEIFHTRPDPASYTMCTGSFPGVKRPGRGVDHLIPSSTEVKERVELYIYSPSRSSWPVLGCTSCLGRGSSLVSSSELSRDTQNCTLY